MRDTVEGSDEPPPFEDPGGLLVDGLVATAIMLAYLLVPIVAFLVVVVPALLAVVAGDVGLLAGLAGLLGALLVSAVLFAGFGYAAAAGLVAFAHRGSMRAAFSPDLVGVLLNGEYVRAHLGAILVALGAGAIKLVVGLIPVVNLLLVVLVPLLVKYVWVVWARLWAEAYAEALDLESEPRATAELPA